MIDTNFSRYELDLIVEALKYYNRYLKDSKYIRTTDISKDKRVTIKHIQECLEESLSELDSPLNSIETA